MIIKVDHRDIEVRGVLGLDNKNTVGAFHDRDCLIEVEVKQSPQQQADTLMHEILHAIWATRSFPVSIGEEALCTRLASALVTVIRDNPGLYAQMACALVNNIPLFC